MKTAALLVALFQMSSCTLPGPPDISPQALEVVSRDSQSWYTLNSIGMPAHPPPYSNGIWILDFPNMESGGRVNYIQTPFRLNTIIPHEVIMKFAIESDAPQYQVSDATDFAPATVHIFFEQQDDNLADANGRWWADTSKYNLGSFDNHTITITVALTHDRWTNVYGKSDLKSFNESLAKVGWIGITFGGQKYWANGVVMKAGSAKFVLLDFSVK